MYLNSCKNSLILNINSSIILTQCCACSAQENKTAHYQRVVKEQRHSASKCLVLIFPLLPVSLSLQGQAQNHTSCTASSLALFHLLKGWIQILTLAVEKQNFSINLEINCWHFSPFSPLMCEEKNKYLWRLKGRWVGEEQPMREQADAAEQRPPGSPGTWAVWWLLLMREQLQCWARWDSQSLPACGRCQRNHLSHFPTAPPAPGSVGKGPSHQHCTHCTQTSAALMLLLSCLLLIFSRAKGRTRTPQAVFDVCVVW